MSTINTVHTVHDDPHAIEQAAQLLSGGTFTLLSGAGVSTDSGIPDYRGPTAVKRARGPVQYRDFIEKELERKRYWAGSVIGYPRMSAVRPNIAHEICARFEADGFLSGTITQNVDSLHLEAGTRHIIELHGALREVRCLACDARESRAALQARLEEANPDVHTQRAALAADGDAEVGGRYVESFVVPSCLHCGGVIMPDVVFFGDSVPRPRVDAAFDILERGSGLLVAGSSLTVFSGFRFARRASELGMPIVILNDGPTRADALATVRISGGLSRTLPALKSALSDR